MIIGHLDAPAAGGGLPPVLYALLSRPDCTLPQALSERDDGHGSRTMPLVLPHWSGADAAARGAAYGVPSPVGGYSGCAGGRRTHLCRRAPCWQAG